MRWGRRLAQQLGGASFKTPDPPRGREKISLLDYPRLHDVDYVSSDPGHVPHAPFSWKFVIAVLAFIGVTLICAIRGGGFPISGASAFFALSTNYGSITKTGDARCEQFFYSFASTDPRRADNVASMAWYPKSDYGDNVASMAWYPKSDLRPETTSRRWRRTQNRTRSARNAAR